VDLYRRHFLKQITIGGLCLAEIKESTVSSSRQGLSYIDPSTHTSRALCMAIDGELHKHPFFDFYDPQAFTRYQPIEDTGYFAVGRRYIHLPRVEWINIQDMAWYGLLLIQNNRILGITRAKSSPHFIEDGWN